jgi:hypothetical protein
METNKNNEDLLYSLPDYITGKLNDEGIIHSIEEEIGRNADFREEYELMKETYSSIKDLEFSEPPAHYFTNMVPRINQRIDSISSFSFAHMFRMANFFKYALPGVSVIVLILIITFTNKNNKNENMLVQTDNTISEIMKTESDSIHTSQELADNLATDENNSDDINNEDNPIQLTKDKIRNVSTQTEVTVNSANIEEMFTESDDAESEDDYVYETDFSTLSGKEQSDLIKKLSNTKF